MNKKDKTNILIIDAKTGTILEPDECYFVDASDLTESESELIQDDASDSEIAEIANKYGTHVFDWNNE